MKRLVLLAWMLIGIIGSASAQRDDLYFVPKKKVKAEAQDPALQESPLEKNVNHDKPVSATPVEEGRGGATLVLEMDEDAYNRRGSYLTEQGDAVSEFAMNDEGFVLITEDGDTMWMNTDTLRLSRVTDGEGWVNGFDGSDSDYEYAMRIIRFRNPRYAIPVSSPLYWDVVYGGALWPSWDWNIYDDGIYAYVFPTTSNWYYWDYRMSYPFGWSAWGSPWSYHYGCHWGHHWGHHWGYYAGYHYGHMWYDPWFNPYFHDYYPGWHHSHHHHGHYPHWGNHGWGGGAPKAYPNHRTPTYASSRRDSQAGGASGRGDVRSSSSSRTGSTAGRVSTDGTRRIYNGSERNSSVRVVTGNSGSMRSSGSSRVGSDEALRRGTGSSSANRSTYTGNASRSSYTSQGTSRSSGSTSSYSRSSSTRVSSSSSMSRSSSSSSGSSRSSYSSGSSSYSSGSSRSSYSSGSSSYSSGSSSRSSYSGGGSYSSGGGSSRSSGSRR